MKKPDFSPYNLYRILYEFYGPSFWWPAQTPFEVIVGSILTQNTAWTNVEKAIVNLKAAGMMDEVAIDNAEHEHLALLLKPSGYYNIKAKRLKNLVHLIMNSYKGRLDSFLSTDLKKLRKKLLEVNGIGKETADSICCYAADKLSFVVDAYTKRILTRHHIISEDATYDDIKALFEQGLPNDIGIYKDLHAHIVYIGKDFCRKSAPRCEVCPLKNNWI